MSAPHAQATGRREARDESAATNMLPGRLLSNETPTVASLLIVPAPAEPAAPVERNTTAAIVIRERLPPGPTGTPTATINFSLQSVEISNVGRRELDRVARDIKTLHPSKIELRS